MTYDFDKVIELLVRFMRPVYQAILDENECFMIWNKEEKKWEKASE